MSPGYIYLAAAARWPDGPIFLAVLSLSLPRWKGGVARPTRLVQLSADNLGAAATAARVLPPEDETLDR